MKIGINALCYSNKPAGISTYIFFLLTNLDTLVHPSDEVIVFFPSACRKSVPKTSRLYYRFLPTGGTITRIIFEQLLLPILVTARGIPLLHSTGNVCPLLLGKKNIVTVHDIYFIHDRKRFTLLKQLYLYTFVKLSVRFAYHCISVSQTTSNDMCHTFGIGSHRCTVVYEGFHLSAHEQEDCSLFSRHCITRPYFLFVGTLEPGKNIPGLIQAFVPLSQKYQLVLTGKKGWGFEDIFSIIAEHDLKDTVIYTGYVTATQLHTLYSHAEACVLPSFHEGFGLPIIEAMARECPVCCSNTSCMPEIAGNAALLFDPCKPAEITQTLRAVTNPQTRITLIEKGLQNVARFSWEANARQTLAIYKKKSFLK